MLIIALAGLVESIIVLTKANAMRRAGMPLDTKP
jgi:hypothetical protein